MCKVEIWQNNFHNKHVHHSFHNQIFEDHMLLYQDISYKKSRQGP